MNIKTYLNAMMFAKVESSLAFRGYIDMDIGQAKRRSRQIHAFRARILRIARNNWRLAWEASELRGGDLQRQLSTERELHELTLAEKDDKIAYLGNANMIFSDKFKEKNREIKRLTDANDAIYRQLSELQERHKFNLEDWGGRK